MIDFNDTTQPAEHNRESERDEIRADLLARLESVLTTMFPAGKKRRGKFLIGDILGSPGDSLEVVLDGEKAGLWTDRATGDGGDIFDLIAAYLGANVHTDFPRVLDEAADLLGRSRSAPVRKASQKGMPVDDLGPATAKWDYFDAAGKLIAVVYRYDPPGGKKEFRPWDAKRRKMAPPEPRPLFNQPGIAAASHVVLVEGEKCAQTLIASGVVATTAMHGANAPGRQDRLVATGWQDGADLARPRRAGVGVRGASGAGDPAGRRDLGRHPHAARRQARGVGCRRCHSRRLRCRWLSGRRRANAGDALS
jgi:putative DNA primase/helicase